MHDPGVSVWRWRGVGFGRLRSGCGLPVRSRGRVDLALLVLGCVCGLPAASTVRSGERNRGGGAWGVALSAELGGERLLHAGRGDRK